MCSYSIRLNYKDPPLTLFSSSNALPSTLPLPAVTRLLQGRKPRETGVGAAEMNDSERGRTLRLRYHH